MAKQYRIIEVRDLITSVVVEVPDDMPLDEVATLYADHELYEVYRDHGDIGKVEIVSLKEPVSTDNQLGLENDNETVWSY